MSDIPLSAHTRPIGLLGNEPFGTLFDINRILTKKKDQFRPFDSMIKLSQTEDEFQETLKVNDRRTIFALLLIADLNDQPDLDRILRTYVTPIHSVHSVYLLLPNGYTFQENYRSILTTKFGWCRSYTAKNLVEQVRDMGRLICHERITYYERKRVDYEYDLNNNAGFTVRSMLEQVAQLTRDNAKLLADYLHELALQVDED